MTLTQITEKGIKDGEIVNADINASAAIAKSKLASLDIVNGDINASAAIAGSKISPDFGSQTVTTTGNLGGKNLNLLHTAPTISLTDSNADDDFEIKVDGGLFKIIDATNTADRLVVDSSGNVGIGLSSGIDRKLHVKSSGLIAKLESTSETSALMFATPNNETASTIPNIGATSSDLTFTTGNLTRLTVKSDGKVGIGSTSPNQKLHVSSGGINLDDGWNTQWGGNTDRAFIQGTSGASGNLILGTNNSSRCRVEGGNFKILDGDLIIGAAGHGIDFSDTTDASGSSSELLDDYEEGSWTPVIGAGSTTAIYSPRYVKIGTLCTVSFAAYGFSDNSSSTALTFSGLPFTSDNQGGAGLSVGACFTAKFSVEANIISYVGSSSTTINFYDHGTGDYDAVRHNNINGTDTTHRLFTTITYRTA